jgi:hypothetical protein
MPRKDFTWLFTFPYLSLVEKVELYLSHHQPLSLPRTRAEQP